MQLLDRLARSWHLGTLAAVLAAAALAALAGAGLLLVQGQGLQTGPVGLGLVLVGVLGLVAAGCLMTARLMRENQAYRATRAEAAHAREQLAHAVNSTSEGFALFDADDRLILCNDVFQAMYDPQERGIMQGMRFEDICRQTVEQGAVSIPDTQRESWIEERLQRHRQGTGTHIQKLGDGRWIQESDRRLADGGTVCTRTDITKLKESQERMVASEARFRDFASSTSDWLWETDREHRFNYFSKAGADNHDLLPPDSLGHRRDEVAVIEKPADNESMKRHIEKLQACQPFRDFDYRIRTEEGELRVIRSSGVPHFDDDGTFLGYRGTSRDVTEALVAEELAVRAQEKLQEAIEALDEGFSLFDSQDRLVVCNSRYRDFYKISRGAIAEGATFESIIRYGAESGQYVIPGNDIEAWIQRSLVEHRNPRDPIELELTDGRWLLVREQQTRDGGRVGVSTDITEYKATLRDLQKARDDAEAASNVKSEFLAVMSHEIRTPMNGVLGMLGLVIDTNLDPEQRGYLLTARDSGEMLLSLIDDILDFSKMEAGKLTLEQTDFHVEEVMEGVVELLAPRAHAKGIEIGAFIDPNVPAMMRGDPGRLRQILLNLAGNAVKFTQAGGVSIELQLERETRDVLVLTGRVVDTGIGIPKDKQDHLFAEFTQLDASYSRKFGGTGLGLAITRRLVELMEGAISVSSATGHGSVFTFSVKLKPTEAVDIQPQDFADAPSRHVLVADANGVTRSLVSRQLVADGHRVTGAENSEDLLETLDNQAPDLMLVDPRFDDGAASDLVRHIRSRAPSIPVFLMLPVGTKPERWLSIGDKISGALLKPVRRGALRRLVQDLEGEARFNRTVAVRDAAPVDDYETLRGLRVLLAEDSQTNRLVATAVLRRAGFHVDSVADGFEAVQAARRLPYDFILMDVSMPGMDGLEATQEIRASNGPESKTPIIALTAHAMEGDRERCIEAGMDDYIPKPVRRDELLRTIRRVVAKDTPVQAPTQPESADELINGHGPAQNDDAALLDETVLAQLESDAGTEAASGLITTFLEEMDDRIEKMVRFADAGDITELERNAHSLKSSSGSFGASMLRDIAAAIEAACLEERPDEARDLVGRLPELSAASRDAFDQWETEREDALTSVQA